MSLIVTQWNIRNLISNKPSLATLCSIINPHVICLQETWSQPNSNINIPGYNVIAHKPRTLSRGGGVAILATTNSPITPLVINSNLEVCAGLFHSNQTSFSIVSLYIPPNYDNNVLETELNDLISQLPTPFLLCADGNGHHQSWGSLDINPRGSILYDWLNFNNLYMLNSGEPTFETPHGSLTHIDLTICSQQLALDFN